MNVTTRTLLLSVAFATSTLLTSCGATGQVGVDIDTPLPDGGRLKGSWNVNIGGDTEADLETVDTICIEVTFSGADGADLGEPVVVEVPGSAQVPEGAVRWEATIVDCPEEEEGDDSGGGGSMFDPMLAQDVTSRSRVSIDYRAKNLWTVLGGPVTIAPYMDGETAKSYSLLVGAHDIDAAHQRVDHFLTGGIGTDVGQGFDVIFYAEAEAELDILGVPVGVRVRHAEWNERFDSFELAINGTVVADLNGTQTLHYRVNRWDVVETFVSVDELDTSAVPNNVARVEWSTDHMLGTQYARHQLSTN